MFAEYYKRIKRPYKFDDDKLKALGLVSKKPILEIFNYFMDYLYQFKTKQQTYLFLQL